MKDILTALAINSAVFSVMFGLMLIARKLLAKKISAVMQYALWAVVAVKLFIPFGFESELSPFGLFAGNNAPPVAQTIVEPGYNISENAYKNYAPVQNGITPSGSEGINSIPEQAAQPGAAVLPAAGAAVNTPAVIDWTAVVFALWAAGALAAGTVMTAGALRLSLRIRREKSPPSARVARIYESCRRELGIRRHIRVFVQRTLETPVIAGAIRPVLLLPGDIDAKDDERIRHIFLHELAHLKHGDLIVIAVLNALCSVYWFNPFVWLCFKLVRKDMEAACDGSVLCRLGAGARQDYIGTVLHFAGRREEGRLKAAMGMADGRIDMEKRIRGMFRRTRTRARTRAAALCVAALMLAACILTACQPTPAEPVVAGKNEGVMESALNSQPSAEPTRYETPERLQLEVEGLPENYNITIDAEVDVSDQAAWPVYTVEPASITQQQADAARLALLGDTMLYKQSEYRSREEIQRSIDSYEAELAASEGYPDLIDAYQQILKDLYIEYEQTPEDIVLEPADTEFNFMEDRIQLLPGIIDGAEEVQTEDGGIRYEWTDAARQSAIDAGYEDIYGVCWMDSGRKMTFSASNGGYFSGVGFYVAEGNLVDGPGVSYSLDEAVVKGNDLLTAMGLDFTLVKAETQIGFDINDENEVVETGQKYHMLTYKRSIEGVPQDSIVSCIDQNITDEYSSPVPSQETIMIILDDFGVYSFSWSNPMNVAAVENANVTLIPFDEISGRIASQLKIQTIWDEQADETEAQWIDSRRLEVDKLVLSYIMTAKPNDISGYYLTPVWNVCGDLIYHYNDSYPTGESNTWVLDENFERRPWRSRYDADADYSILTINAIDGSVIPRYRHY